MNKEMNKKLRPCPFCGREAMMKKVPILKGKHLCWVECTDAFCVNMEKYHITEDGAVRQWNRRKPMERIVERLEEESYEYTSDPTDLGFVTKGRKLYLKDAINIVKEEGGLNDNRTND